MGVAGVRALFLIGLSWFGNGSIRDSLAKLGCGGVSFKEQKEDLRK